MLCRACHRRLPCTGDACPLCGVPRPDATDRPRYSVVLPDGTRAPVRGELSVGRAAGNRLRLDDPAVSRRHALVLEREGAPVIADDRSLNGVFVNGRRVQEEPLHHGDEVRIGNRVMRFVEIHATNALKAGRLEPSRSRSTQS